MHSPIVLTSAMMARRSELAYLHTRERRTRDGERMRQVGRSARSDFASTPGVRRQPRVSLGRTTCLLPTTQSRPCPFGDCESAPVDGMTRERTWRRERRGRRERERGSEGRASRRGTRIRTVDDESWRDEGWPRAWMGAGEVGVVCVVSVEGAVMLSSELASSGRPLSSELERASSMPARTRIPTTNVHDLDSTHSHHPTHNHHQTHLLSPAHHVHCHGRTDRSPADVPRQSAC